jgi:dienelactone hydrolase
MATSIHTETLEYSANGVRLLGHLAYDGSRQGRRPGVVLFGEWWGLTDVLKRRAHQIAELGYVALAADVYGDGRQAADAAEAGKLMGGLMGDVSVATARVTAAVETLRSRPQVDPARLGAMGYCLGGALSLHAARLGLDLRGVVSFHGSLGRTHPAKAGDVKGKVLVCHGGADTFISDDELTGFIKEMRALDVDLEFQSYPGVKHGFTNPEATAKGQKYGLNLAYDASADTRSWDSMKGFWARVFA